MAERSQFFDTTSVGDGTGSGYTEDNLRQQHSRMMTTTLTTEGVLFGVGNNLAVSGASSPVSINTGAAFVYGYFYENDSSLSVSIATPTTSTRVDVIVLRVSWAAQTVRITRVAGTEGAGVPSITQTANTTWDIPLANVSITTGGVITLTDRRTYCKSPAAYGWFNQALTVNGALTTAGTITSNGTFTSSGSNLVLQAPASSPVYVWSPTAGYGLNVLDAAGSISVISMLNSGAASFSGTVTVGALGGSGVVSNTNLASGIDASKLTTGTLPAARLPASGVDASSLTVGTLPAARLGANSVDDSYAGNRIATLYRRQGGSATDWSAAGTSTQTPTLVREQMGVINKAFASATVVSQTVTFPVAFSQTPAVTFSLGPTQSFSGGGNISYVSYSSVSTTGVTLNVTFTSAVTGNLDFTWRATGTV